MGWGGGGGTGVQLPLMFDSGFLGWLVIIACKAPVTACVVWFVILTCLGMS